MQVTVFNTVGSNEQSVEFNGATKSELESVLRENNVIFEGMAMIVGETQVTLDSAQAQTPQSDFTLFLLPKEVKSGSDEDYNDDENYNDDDYDNYVPETPKVYSLGTQQMIDSLEQAKAAIESSLSILRGQYITDARTLELTQKARELQASLRR